MYNNWLSKYIKKYKRELFYPFLGMDVVGTFDKNSRAI